MPKPVRVVLVAEEAAGVKALQAVTRSACELAAVFTTPGEARGASVGDVARGLGLPVHPAQRVKDPALARELADQGIDLLLNVHSLFLIAGEVVDAPRIGSFNLHPGPLPAYAGLNAPSWAIYHREPSHGVTLHWMTSGIDTGAIAYEARFPLTESDTGLTVSARCVREGLPLVRRLLDAASSDPASIPARPQDLSRRRLYRRGDVPHGGRVAWDLGAAEIDAFVRAADYFPMPSPWGHPRAVVDGREVGLVKVARTGRPADAPPGTTAHGAEGLAVACADEWLVLKRIHRDGQYVDGSAPAV